MEAMRAQCRWGCGWGHGSDGGGTILAKPKKATILKQIPSSLLKDFLAGNNDKLSQEEGSNTGSNNNSNGKNNEGADDNNSEEQVKEKNK